MTKPDYSTFSREQLIEALDLVLEINANLRATLDIRSAMDKYLPLMREMAAQKLVADALAVARELVPK